MATLTLKEKQLPDDFFQPPGKKKEGDPWLVIERVLTDTSGNPVGSATIRGTFMKVDPPDNPLIATNATNRITSGGQRGLICTQGLFRYSDLANPVPFAIVGGTGDFNNARGTLTVDAATQTLVFDYLT